MNTPKRLPTYFISHGGGPWPWLMNQMPGYENLDQSLKAIPKELGQLPSAVLVISGHWEENEFAVMATPKPPMVYDYGGFPEFTYHIQYPAPGAPAVAARVHELLKAAGISSRLDHERGYDHGTFAPLFAMYPAADVPVLQLSLKSGYDPKTHLELGRALKPLRDENVLIIGSGLSFHNLRLFRSPAVAQKVSAEFDQWLQDAVLHSEPKERERKLMNWESAPSARQAHPEEDHLIPLMVALGAAEDEPARLNYHEKTFFGGISATSFRFG